MRHVVRKPFADVVTAEIRAAILDGTLAPGSRIRQEELAARLGVSRAPIREALVVLEREGLVRTQTWRGAAVAPLDRELIANIYEFRAAIDTYVASTLAARSDVDPNPFRKIVTKGRAAAGMADVGRLIDLDSRFHMGLYEAVGNVVLVDVMRGQWTHICRAMAATLTISGYPRQVWAEHAAIVEAIARRQANRAARLAHAHTANARTILVDSLTHAGSRARAAEASRSSRGKRTQSSPTQKAGDFEPTNPAVDA